MHVRWIADLRQVDKEAWDGLEHPRDYPFLEWDWLVRLEQSGSVGPGTGWHPMHLTLWSGKELAGAAAMYIKTHGQGEFVFDRLWADAAEYLGLPYYPKLVGMSPFSPVPGYRLLVAQGVDAEGMTSHAVHEMRGLVSRLGLGGIHFLFADPEWMHILQSHAFLVWRHQCYEWVNPGYADFDQFLAGFRSSHRKKIKKEDRAVREQGITVRILPGEALSSPDMERMYRMYVRTNMRYGPWACKFLTREFFLSLLPALSHRLLILQAETEHGDVAGMAMFMHKNGALFGRYWGAAKDLPYLHFVLCYYEPLKWAIAQNMHRFDPGAGSEHKAKRGFTAKAAYSLHWLAHSGMQALMHSNIGEVNALEQEHIDELNAMRPLKRR